MNVTTEDIRNIKPGQVKPFLCENAMKMQSAATMVGNLKRLGMQEGVVDYEVQKYFEPECIILIHAMKEGEEKVLNR